MNFIKLDIEGAELRAFQGAEESIRNHKPKLPGCLYQISGILRSPQYLASLDLGYRFYIGHVPTNDRLLRNN